MKEGAGDGVVSEEYALSVRPLRPDVRRRVRASVSQTLALVLVLISAGSAGPPSTRAQVPTWADRCSARLESARTEFARIAPWAGDGDVEVTPLPAGGFLVTFTTNGTDYMHAIIQDYTGATLEPWRDAGLGECFDETERPPDVNRSRNYLGRQAQFRIDRAPRRVRARLRAALEAALDECATY